jgi:hypothetical protein
LEPNHQYLASPEVRPRHKKGVALFLGRMMDTGEGNYHNVFNSGGSGELTVEAIN